MSEHTERPENGDEWIERLRELRSLLGWSQRRLAKELRVTPGAVSQWESGQRAIPGPIQRLVEIYEQNLGMIDPPVKDGVKKLNSSWAGRSLRASTMTAGIAARLAGSRLRTLIASNTRATEIKAATERVIARQVADTLGELKGFLMKYGQMISYLEFSAPEEVRAILRELQDETRAMSFEHVERTFEEELGATPDHVFARFERRPFAAASIGQVHRAFTKDGEEVAVKVQYPGIRRALASDVTTVRGLDKIASLFFRAEDGTALVDELRTRLLEECDYEQEAKNQAELRRLHATTTGVVVPRVFSEQSTRRILTSELVQGRNFQTFVSEATEAERNRAGELIFRFALTSIFEHHLFNADPHPGNYLFLEGGDVAFLDFGCVKRFPDALVRGWAQYARALMDRRREDADRLAVKLGLVADEDRFDFDYHYAMMQQLYRPWATPGPQRFTAAYVERNWRTMVVENPNKTRMRMPPDFLFAHRLEWGLHSVLASLGATADWNAIMEDALATALRDDAHRPRERAAR